MASAVSSVAPISALSQMMSPPALLDLAGKLAPMASMVLFMAPIPTITSITKNKKVGALPLLPYSSMTANAFLWTIYGLMKKEAKIWSSNGVGLIFAIFYFTQFARFAPSFKMPLSTLPGSVKQHVFATLAIMATASTIALTMGATQVVGIMAVILCLALFGSPLTALKTVFDTKSASSIPLPLALATTVNCFLWIIVGFFDMKDPLAVIPNSIGLVLGLFQLGLKVKYGNGLTTAAENGSVDTVDTVMTFMKNTKPNKTSRRIPTP
eukprot:CAMPEP_0198152864 /NCGR_PEP_ID=MMETSP1443-20131203/61524_1 /TAXON_ID=186043 /ORGANISM="Entomoneis sp., Strain CCMP2396" /LENGTH=266 /DNA_ID=CAMNT_0043818997 /DNA_START=72 /DNA_END=872 /DNA_ORIENTATION=+